MSTDTDMGKSYAAALREAERELAGMDSRRRALQATIEGLRRLVRDEDGQLPLGDMDGETPHQNGKRPTIPPDFFKGKKPTQAYRDFVRLWGEDHPLPEIRDAMVDGGIETKSKTSLLTQLHSVVRREKEKKKRKEEEAREASLR